MADQGNSFYTVASRNFDLSRESWGEFDISSRGRNISKYFDKRNSPELNSAIGRFDAIVRN